MKWQRKASVMKGDCLLAHRRLLREKKRQRKSISRAISRWFRCCDNAHDVNELLDAFQNMLPTKFRYEQ